MTTIWVLQGSTGEYSDRTDWIVRAYTTEEAATAAEQKATEESWACFTELRSLDVLYNEPKELAVKAKHLTIDPGAQFDYTGTTYWVKSCELA